MFRSNIFATKLGEEPGSASDEIRTFLYELRDVDGTPVTFQEAQSIIAVNLRLKWFSVTFDDAGTVLRAMIQLQV
jgi:hypothetical protein